MEASRKITTVLFRPTRVFHQSPGSEMQLYWEGKFLRRGTKVVLGEPTQKVYDHSTKVARPLIEKGKQPTRFIIEDDVALHRS